jgi:sec-independent protein translocase protein TatA
MFVLGEIVGWEFLLVLVVVGLLFGSSKIPELARSLGHAKREFEQGLSQGDGEAPSGAPPPTEPDREPDQP